MKIKRFLTGGFQGGEPHGVLRLLRLLRVLTPSDTPPRIGDSLARNRNSGLESATVSHGIAILGLGVGGSGGAIK